MTLLLSDVRYHFFKRSDCHKISIQEIWIQFMFFAGNIPFTSYHRVNPEFLHKGKYAFRANDPACFALDPASNKPIANIRQGSKGDGVKWVQWNLKNKGYDIRSAGVDDICGKATAAAIIKFQRDKGLSADGICGVKTREKLRG